MFHLKNALLHSTLRHTNIGMMIISAEAFEKSDAFLVINRLVCHIIGHGNLFVDDLIPSNNNSPMSQIYILVC